MDTSDDDDVAWAVPDDELVYGLSEPGSSDAPLVNLRSAFGPVIEVRQQFVDRRKRRDRVELLGSSEDARETRFRRFLSMHTSWSFVFWWWKSGVCPCRPLGAQAQSASLTFVSWGLPTGDVGRPAILSEVT